MTCQRALGQRTPTSRSGHQALFLLTPRIMVRCTARGRSVRIATWSARAANHGGQNERARARRYLARPRPGAGRVEGAGGQMLRRLPRVRQRCSWTTAITGATRGDPGRLCKRWRSTRQARSPRSARKEPPSHRRSCGGQLGLRGLWPGRCRRSVPACLSNVARIAPRRFRANRLTCVEQRSPAGRPGFSASASARCSRSVTSLGIMPRT